MSRLHNASKNGHPNGLDSLLRSIPDSLPKGTRQKLEQSIRHVGRIEYTARKGGPKFFINPSFTDLSLEFLWAKLLLDTKPRLEGKWALSTYEVYKFVKARAKRLPRPERETNALNAALYVGSQFFSEVKLPGEISSHMELWLKSWE